LVVLLNINFIQVQFLLDSEGNLANIQVLGNETVHTEFFRIDTDKVLFEARKLEKPNDIRSAIFYIQAAMESRQSIKEDILKLKKQMIIKHTGSSLSVIECSTKNGSTIWLETSPFYPMVSSLSLSVMHHVTKQYYI
jgi:hypothetical protein